MKENDPLVLTVLETAALLRISRNTAYSLISQGKIPAVRLGKRLLIPRRALLRLLGGGADAEEGAQACDASAIPSPRSTRPGSL